MGLSSGSIAAAAAAAGYDEARVEAQGALLARLEIVAADFAAAGEHEDAIAVATLAAQLALPFHPGVHTARGLERVLEATAAAALEPLPAREPPRPDSPQAVLHVVTETYAVGGHTRVIWRWIDRDRRRRHTVVTTAQNGEVPEGLAKAVTRTGGEVVALAGAAPALERAARVRALAADADVVVVHSHSHDPVPALAFGAAGDRPPVVVLNHGDHLLWLGAGCADAVHNLRAVGDAITTQRRGIAPERSLVLPFPITGADANVRRLNRRQRESARAELFGQLGWPADTVLLLSVGAGYKFTGAPGATLAELVEPLLTAGSRARLLLLGPVDPVHAEASRRTEGRLKTFAAQAGIGALFGSADVYLESRPLGGPGATGEAAAYGLPVLTCAASPLEAELFCTDPLYGAVVAIGAEDYRAQLTALIEDPAHRGTVGRAALAAAQASDRGWEAAVERSYACAATAGPASAAALSAPDALRDELDVLVAYTGTIHARVAPAAAERVVAVLELCARSPAIRALYDRLDAAGAAAPPRSWPTAFAAPPADPDALRAVVAAFVVLAQTATARAFVLSIGPDEAEAAIGVLEAALEPHPDLPVDLSIEADPAGSRPAGSLLLTFEEPSDLDVLALRR